MSQRAILSASIQASFPNNTSGFITPTGLRDEQGLFNGYAVLNEQTASIIAQAASSLSSGSLATTASLNAYTASTNIFTGSIQTQVNTLQAATSSYVKNNQTSSFVNNSQTSSFVQNSQTSSFVTNAQTSSFATSAITGSSLTTASVSSNTITFTKGDASTFNLTVNTGSATVVDTGSLVTTSSFNAYTASTNTFTGSIQTQVNTLQSATSSYVTNAQTGSFVTSAITGSSFISASVALNTITFTEGDGTTLNITVNTGSGGGGGMNLGANTFTGSQTIASSSVYITPTGSTLQYLTESDVKGNLIFGNINLAQSGSVIVTGSLNILLGVGATTSNDKGGFIGNRNILMTSPVYSSSAAPSASNNVMIGNFVVSGSGTGINTINTTYLNSTQVSVINTSPNGSTTINNSNINSCLPPFTPLSLNPRA